MEQGRRYRGFRLYLHDSGEEIQKDNTSDTTVLPRAHDMGNFGPSFRSRREQYNGDRLLLCRNGRYRFVAASAQVVGLLSFVVLISANADNWKSIVLFLGLMILLFCKLALLAAPLILKWARAYFRV
jgi:hypothetical protein